MRLNLGSGLQPMDGWVNVDQCDLPGVDLVHDLDSREPLPYPDASVSEFRAQHVIEHLRDPLRMMGECYRVAEPDALFILTCPYGSSDDADANPTHCRRMFLGSCGFFGQPYYWREDYGYRGDWRIEQKKSVIDFPVLCDGNVASSVSVSEVLQNMPIVAVDFVFVDPTVRRQVKEWLDSNLKDIVASKEE